MRRKFKWLITATLLLALLGGGGWWLYRQLPPTATPMALDPIKAVRAELLLSAIEQGRYDDAQALFGPQMRQALSAAELKALWEALPMQLGGPPKIDPARGELIGDTPVVSYRLNFPSTALDLRVAVDDNGLINGLRIVPASNAFVAAPPLSPEAPLTERDLAVRVPGHSALDATLAMPLGDGPFPGVVLVHGSGPQDRDQTIGPNKPFADIARRLAARGIAVLRYDKRTFAHPQEFGASFTVDDETTDDALAAVATLRKLDRVDPQRVFVLGHSLGGMLAPRIAQRDPTLAGLILMAAPALPLADKVVAQTRYSAWLDGAPTTAEEIAIARLEGQRNAVRSLTTIATAPADLMLGLPAAYWIDLNSYDPVAVAQEIPQPLLIVAGDRDYQVDHNDWQRWQDAFARSPRVTLKRFPRLNHLFMAGDRASTPNEHLSPGTVDRNAIEDIAQWIAAQPPVSTE